MVGRSVALVAVLLMVSAPARAQTWREVKTEHFTMVSDAGEGRARRIIWQFEQMRRALQDGFPWMQVNVDRPVLVIAVKDENSMRAIAPQFWEQRGPRPGSVFIGGADRHYIMLRTDLEVEDQLMNPYNNAYRAYSSLVLTQGLGRDLPLWLTNGLTVMLSNTIVRQREIVFGRPMPWVVEVAREGPRLPLADLLSADTSSPGFRGAIARERFDAQSWALVEYMLYGRKDDARARFDRVIELLASGQTSEAAIVEVYGSLPALDDAYTLFVQQNVYTHNTTPTSRDIVEGKLAVRVMSVPEHAAVRAAFHVAMGRPVEARAVATTARKADPASPVADDIEGMLHDYEQNRDAAMAAFAKAVAAGSTSYWTHYRLASLRLNTGADGAQMAEVDVLLERAAALEPSFAPAYSQLATLRINRGEVEPAVVAARRAVELDPGDLSYRSLLVRILTRATQTDEALRVAREALAMARTPEERAGFEALIEAAQR
jgi:tetratricopeptide (TPR) repeat protein